MKAIHPNTSRSVHSRASAIRLLATLVCASTLVAPHPAKAISFGDVAEESLYAGAAIPLFYAGAFVGIGAVAVGGYVAFDVGESFYFGFRETAIALSGGVPEDWAYAAIPGDTMLGRKLDRHATLGAGLALNAKTTRQMVDFAFDPRFQIGDAATDVWGIRLGLLSAVNHDVCGLDLCTLAGRTLGDEYGLQLGLLNLVDGEVGGIQIGLANVAGNSGLGLQLAGLFSAAAGDAPYRGAQVSGLMNRAHDFRGLQVAYADVADRVSGLQLGGYAEADHVDGAQVSIVCRTMELAGMQVGAINVCLDLDHPGEGGDMDGVQMGIVNICRHGTGLQLGVWNQARSLCGVQIGLCNVITEGAVPFLPIVNASF